MKLLIYLIVAATLTIGCTPEPQVAEMAREQELSFYDMHCREHAEDMYATEFAPGRYMECMQLHKDDIVLVGTSDEHLATAH